MVSKTKEMITVQQRFGETLEELIPRLFNDCGNSQEVASKMGISRSTLHYWRLILGIRIKRATLVVDDDESLPEKVS